MVGKLKLLIERNVERDEQIYNSILSFYDVIIEDLKGSPSLGSYKGGLGYVYSPNKRKLKSEGIYDLFGKTIIIFEPIGNNHWGFSTKIPQKLKDYGYTNLILCPILKGGDLKGVSDRLDKNKFIHEATHIADFVQGRIPEDKPLNFLDDLDEYYNNASEMNGFWMEASTLVKRMFKKFESIYVQKYLMDYNRFESLMFSTLNDDFLSHLSDNNIKRLKKWMYQFYTELRMIYLNK